MTPRPQLAEEGPLSWIERWSPADGELWVRWRRSLSKEQRANVLLPLQSALSGLVALRRLEDDRGPAPPADFRPQLHAVRATYRWALELARVLQASHEPDGPLLPVASTRPTPEVSLRALCRSLTDALQICERLLDLPVVDASVFGSSCDFFLRDLGRNAFFNPPEPLEFANVAELLGGERISTGFDASRRDASRTAVLVAFLALLRCHRFLGIADRQMSEPQGIYRAHVVLAGVQRELRMLARLLVVQDSDGLVRELERTLVALATYDAENPLPEPEAERGLALPSERMRNEIRMLRRNLKTLARRLRDLEGPSLRERDERVSGRVRKSLHHDVWAFRFILRAFIAKASAVSLADGTHDVGRLGFAGEFVRHFRTFGPRVAKGTGYGHRGPLTTAVSALIRREAIDEETLACAITECERFAVHLDRALATAAESSAVAFDKHEAAESLRAYLRSATQHVPSEPPMGAFGALDRSETKTG